MKFGDNECIMYRFVLNIILEKKRIIFFKWIIKELFEYE